jgi:MATE family multidrug resistance protein
MKQITTVKFINKYFQIAGPLMMSNIVRFIISMTDTYMVGQLGNQYLAAAQLANGIFYVLHSFMMGVTFGITADIGSKISNYKYKEAAEIFRHSLIINCSIAIVMSLISLLIYPHLTYLNSNSEIGELAKPYFFIVTSISFLITGAFYTFIRYLEAIARTRVILVINILFCCTNALLNYIFINGKLGFPEMKLTGAGLGTLGSTIIAFFALILYMFFSKKMIKYVVYIKKSINYKSKIFLDIAKVGITIGSHQVLEVGFSIVTVIMLGWLSVDEQAANSLLDNIFRLVFLITWALSTASCVMVSKCTLPHTTLAQTRQLGNMCFFASIITISIVLILLNTTIIPILGLYNANESVVHIINESKTIALIFGIVDCIYMVGLGILRGLKDTFIPFLITTLVNWFIGLPICYLLIFKFKMGVLGTWVGCSISFVIVAVFMLYRFYLPSWNKWRKA